MFLLVWAFWNSYERPLVWEALPLVAWKPGRETESWGLHWKCIQFWRNDLAVYNKINYNQHYGSPFFKVVRIYGHYPNNFWQPKFHISELNQKVHKPAWQARNGRGQNSATNHRGKQASPICLDHFSKRGFLKTRKSIKLFLNKLSKYHETFRFFGDIWDQKTVLSHF